MFVLNRRLSWQSAKTNLNVEQVFFSVAKDIMQRLAEADAKPEVEASVVHVKKVRIPYLGVITNFVLAGSCT